MLSDHYAFSAGTVSVIVIFFFSPMKHLGVLKNSFKRVRAFQIKFNLKVLVFRRGENRSS